MAVSASFLILLALLILILPLQWVTAAVVAAIFHEWCHYLAIRFCGGKTTGFQIGAEGSSLRIQGLTRRQELFCALAGPMGGLFLLLFARWIPRTALCAGFQSIFNLLPIFPLDGGRALRCLGAGENCSKLVERIFLAGILTLGAWATFRLHLGFAPIGLSLLVVHRAKRPCKLAGYSLQ